MLCCICKVYECVRGVRGVHYVVCWISLAVRVISLHMMFHSRTFTFTHAHLNPTPTAYRWATCPSDPRPWQTTNPAQKQGGRRDTRV